MSIFRRNQKEAAVIVFFSALKFSINLLSIGRFGFQRDEFLHLALSRHPSWGYLEVPPFISLISWLSTHIFGDSLVASRLLPSVFGAGIVYLTGLMVMAMGGKRFAVSVACLGVIVSPAFLASGYLLQPVVFDQFFWAITAFLLIKFVKTKKVSYLYWIGACTGLGMLNKYTMLLYAFSLFTGVMISSQRKLLYTRHLAGAIALALLIFLPNLIWQFQHDFPVVNHMHELSTSQLSYVNPISFIISQLLDHATGLFIWLAGFIYLFFSRVRKQYIFISFAYLVTMVLLAVLHGKAYYGFGSYPALFAAGGMCWQQAMIRITKPWRYTILASVLAPALLFLPVAVPILPFPATLRFFGFLSSTLEFKEPLKWEDQQLHATTQDYADMLGWQEMTDLVHQAYQGLTTKEKQTVTIFAGNYGEAGAIDHLGKKYGLPQVVCLNSSYRLWAPAGISYQNIILIDDDAKAKMTSLFASVLKIGEVTNPYSREKGTAVYLLSRPLTNVNEVYLKYRK